MLSQQEDRQMSEPKPRLQSQHGISVLETIFNNHCELKKNKQIQGFLKYIYVFRQHHYFYCANKMYSAAAFTFGFQK